ncbi:Rv3212 family protein [Rhodococcoides corynebacterioides]|uniref:PQQ-binding-like beta-propeller repeat protein n=1 Tax=Rhodococcoides corynebacterioides TaxID=53972 RepID=A0ABS7P210_9NOCA|nr:hypothetical protein [Rhodococcus corynebacterioides]MBY6365932.1 hypothetical protein [Rhodococcus corynebacterioides]MBY6408575.1 hypothetical protein [Rhodococcus corynebacterioides]
MLAPERRTRADVIAAAAIVVVALVAAVTIWWTSDARGTTSVVADSPVGPPPSALSVPESVRELWRTDDAGRGTPIVVGGTVVTSDEHAVRGLDPATGDTRWSYTRDRVLCGVVGAWDAAVATYRDDRGCGQVTELDGASGAREDQRTNDADDPARLGFDGTYVTQMGASRLEVWRSDLVRTLEYGRVDAPLNPGSQPRSGCTLISSASASSRVAVLERCPGETGLRLTTMNPAPKDATVPEVYGSTVLADVSPDVDTARVLGVVGDRIALYLPPSDTVVGRVALFDGSATFLSATPFTEPVTTTWPDARSTDLVRTGSILVWWTGSAAVGFDQSTLERRWVLPGALGAGAIMAGQLLVPVPEGLAVADTESGTVSRTLPVARADEAAPVTVAVLGTRVVEGRAGLDGAGGSTVVLG